MESPYDQLNPWGADYDYWLDLVHTISPASLVDLGCGTGQLTVLLAQHAKETLGVDPDPEMLAVARNRPGTARVNWVEGYAEDVAHGAADLVTMTSHVSQVFLTDRDWMSTLRHLHRALRPGGVIAFDMRNPLARGWEAWNPRDSLQNIDTENGPAEQWHEVTGVGAGLVSFTTRLRWSRSGQVNEFFNTLRFRDQANLVTTLHASGFTVERCDGDWDGSAADETSRELIVNRSSDRLTQATHLFGTIIATDARSRRCMIRVTTPVWSPVARVIPVELHGVADGHPGTLRIRQWQRKFRMLR